MSRSSRWLRDHPRIRGEHQRQRVHGECDRGIIPAYAGSTTCLRVRAFLSSGSSPHTRGALNGDAVALGRAVDHPRIRGEHDDRFQALEVLAGSSPHTRGAPAASSTGASTSRDHPRIRGEHNDSGVLGDSVQGIIPAYAGSTSSSISATAASKGSSPHTRGARAHHKVNHHSPRDHPRIRGEHLESD